MIAAGGFVREGDRSGWPVWLRLPEKVAVFTGVSFRRLTHR